MTHTPQDGGPAFPVSMPYSESGMSLRDWFAGKNMAAMMGSILEDAINDENMKNKDKRAEFFGYVSQLALEAADAMIAERNKL